MAYKKSPFKVMKYCEFLSPEAFHEGYEILYSTCKKSKKIQVLWFYLVDWWVCQVLHCIFKLLKCLFQSNPQNNLSLTGAEHYDSYWWYIQNLHVTFTFYEASADVYLWPFDNRVLLGKVSLFQGFSRETK